MTVTLTLHDNPQRTYTYGGVTSVRSTGDVLTLREGEYAIFGILTRLVALIELDTQGGTLGDS